MSWFTEEVSYKVIRFEAFKVKHPKDFSPLYSRFYKIYVKRTFTNLMVTVTDFRNKTLGCHTSGSSGVVGTSRIKRSPQSMESIARKFFPLFTKFKLHFLEFVFSRKLGQPAFYLVRELRYFGIRIALLRRRTIVAHNGVRRRKQPRK